jgi:competence protein ComFC
MRCIICEKISLFNIICSNCQKTILAPSLHQRKLKDGLRVISFYKYDEIQDLLKTKGTYLGFYVLNTLAKISMKHFAESFAKNLDENQRTFLVPIDDSVSLNRGGYSHTAVLANQLKVKKNLFLLITL